MDIELDATMGVKFVSSRKQGQTLTFDHTPNRFKLSDGGHRGGHRPSLEGGSCQIRICNLFSCTALNRDRTESR